MQFGNTITINEQTHRLFGEPLEKYWSINNNKPRICKYSSSPLDTGYYAHWKLSDNKLYLSDFYGQCLLLYKTEYWLKDIFPNVKSPVFAEWFEGELRIQIGNRINVPHMARHHFGETLENTVTMIFNNGHLTSTTIHDT